MPRHPAFLKITTADFIARAAYQMGKTPLLPIFAASLGAGDAFLGFIVSVSTLTGMFLKPLFGVLSDYGDRRNWLLLGTGFFAFMPFLYWFVETPAQLLVVRLVHGTATAVYGPVTLAYVAELRGQHVGKGAGERLGWFGLARSGGYIVGPALGGLLLLWLEPAAVFTVIGLLSCLALWPVWRLDPQTDQKTAKAVSAKPLRQETTNQPTLSSRLKRIWHGLWTGGRTPAVWLAGSLEGVVYIGVYALKAFLPLYALSVGVNTAVVGLFFALQEGTQVLLKPLGGRWGDTWGYRLFIGGGMFFLGGALMLITHWHSTLELMVLAVIMGAAQALIFPCTVALISRSVHGRMVGAGMGFFGTLQNGGKVLGPIVGGVLIAQLDYAGTFYLLGGALVVGAILMMLSGWGQIRTATAEIRNQIG